MGLFWWCFCLNKIFIVFFWDVFSLLKSEAWVYDGSFSWFGFLQLCVCLFAKDGWQSRWVRSDWKRAEGKAGSFKHTAGKWSGDPDDKGLALSCVWIMILSFVLGFRFKFFSKQQFPIFSVSGQFWLIYTFSISMNVCPHNTNKLATFSFLNGPVKLI